MHTQPVLQKFFRESLPEVHQTRCQALIVAVDAVARGARVTITGLGRSLANTGIRIKHRVKRMDRLIGNRLLGAQRKAFYRVIVLRLLAGCRQPIILVDWSDFSVDREPQLLRASLAVGRRAITLFEELHPYRKLGNRQVQHRFLNQLRTMVPTHCTPIIIADAGFRVPFYRHVETLGWHWLGRIRNRDFVQWSGAPSDWISAKSLHGIASIRAHDLGDALWVRNHPLAGRLVLIMQNLRGRKHRSLTGPARRGPQSRKHALPRPRAVAVDRFAQSSGFERKTTRALVPDPHADRRGLSRYQIGGLWLGHRERAAHHVGTRRQSAVDRRTGQLPVVGDWMSGRGARLAPTGDC